VDLSEQLDTEEIAWKIAAAGTGLLAAAAARGTIKTIWRSTRGGEPPEHPESPHTDWGDAIAWAALTGVAVAVSELVVRRLTASTWQQARGHLPPSLAQDA
jgi:hypothetical protein